LTQNQALHINQDNCLSSLVNDSHNETQLVSVCSRVLLNKVQ